MRKAPESMPQEVIELTLRLQRQEQLTKVFESRYNKAHNELLNMDMSLLELTSENERLKTRIAELEEAAAPPAEETK